MVFEVSDIYVNKDGIKVIDRFFTVPLDHATPDGPKIRIFARNLVPLAKASRSKTTNGRQNSTRSTDDSNDGDRAPLKDKGVCDLPIVVYLQGGPGFEVNLQGNSSYAKELHEQGYQTLWLDQRGTGLSTSLSHETLPEHLKTEEEKAAYCKHFRADSIVKDCELIRKELLSERPEHEQKWSILGQSFGGFCAITYLSFHPEGLSEVFITGGLAPLYDHPDPVYQAVVARVVKRNQVYYSKYPQDIARVRQIVSYLEDNGVTLPNGGNLSVQRWLSLGIAFGAHGGIDTIHQLVFRATNDLEIFGKLSYKTLQMVQDQHSFDTNPIYAVLHEAIYCQGKASKWSASRIMKDQPQFQWSDVKKLADTEPIYFTGEMIFPEMFDDHSNLRPLKGVAEILANDKQWGPLYDLERLAKNEVKVSAVTYVEDMYVDFDLAQETASKIKNTEQYITNQLFHNGLRHDPKDVIKTLLELSKREYD
ncbi:hypothetical protein HGRIS_001929 [Hohenbuehelia grisea]|uniref:AB hydrolase-1 domain-containing protein n=1 Tax=Hohenbuehelia grisea TaxID=104357 RepID=A0ABR3JIW9_9AGAR